MTGWLSFLIVAGAFLLLMGLAVFVGLFIEAGKGPRPRRTPSPIPASEEVRRHG